MRALIKSIMVVSALVTLFANTAVAHDDSDRSEIKEVLSTYAKALNASNVKGAVALYTTDGVFMPPNRQPNVGIEAVRMAYTNAFKTIDLDDVEFMIQEIVQLSPTWAFVRTLSKGSLTILATGKKVEPTGGNQELFVLQKQSDDNWKIARYIFNSPNPPRQSS